MRIKSNLKVSPISEDQWETINDEADSYGERLVVATNGNAATVVEIDGVYYTQVFRHTPHLWELSWEQLLDSPSFLTFKADSREDAFSLAMGVAE